MVSGEGRPAHEVSGRPTIAILPFKNISSDPENEYFSDGITEELITAFSAIDGLKVISRTSVMQYKSSTKGMIEIASELSTDTLVEGSVRKAANKVRIAVELIDGRDEGHMWTQTYDRLLDDIFAVQSEIAEKVAEALKVVEDPDLHGLRFLHGKLMTAFVYAAMGKEGEARGLLTEVEGGFDKEVLSPYWLARLHFLLHDRDDGFNWLERAYADDDYWLTRMGIDSEFDAVRSDPRYVAMLQKIGLGQVMAPDTHAQAAEEGRAERLASNLLKSGYRRVEDKLSVTLAEIVTFNLVTFNRSTSEYIVCDYCERVTKATIDGFIDKLNELGSSNFEYKVRMGVMLSDQEVQSDAKGYAEKRVGSKYALLVVSDPDEARLGLKLAPARLALAKNWASGPKNRFVAAV